VYSIHSQVHILGTMVQALAFSMCIELVKLTQTQTLMI